MADDTIVRSGANPKLKRFQTVASGAKGAFAEFKKEEEKGRAQTKYAADEFSTDGVGTQAGIYLWRIENLKPVSVLQKDYGKFFTGDSYILLYSKQVKNWLVHDIHFWLGKESTIDETGAAAYKTVELEEKLGGQATQHREVQGHESDKFMTYFPDGVMYNSGGVESAFVHVDKTAFEPRLLHVKGRKNIRSRQVPIARSSLNDGDVFILDANSVIYQFNGKGASRAEKAKATKITQNIKDLERGGKARMVILNQDDEDRDNLVDWVAFWDFLGGKGPIAADTDDDVKAEQEIGKEVRLYHVSDAKGQLEINLLPSPISKRQLNSMDAYILDCRSEIFVWIGKGATQLEKNEALAQAKKFLVSHQRPSWTPLTRIMEGSEPVLFIEKFPDWPEATDARTRYSQLALLSKLLEECEADKKASQIDVTALIENTAEGAERLQMDSGSHKLSKKYYVDANGKKKETKGEDIGRMYEGNAYVIVTKYKLKGEERTALYNFFGRRALPSDRDAAEAVAKKMSKKTKKFGPDVRIIPIEQGRPDSDFVSLFHGSLVTFRGETAPRRRVSFALPYNTKFGESIFLTGSAPALGNWNPEKAMKLTWDNGVWRGQIALDLKSVEYKFFTSDEYGRSTARWESCPNRRLELKDRPEAAIVEVDDTWDNVTPSVVRELPAPVAPTAQLFHVRGTSLLNTFAAETQPAATSLNSGDSFILRGKDTLQVWFGSGCNSAERKLAHMAARILRPAPNVDADEFDEGKEPESFWTLLGGRAEYAKPVNAATAPPTRLFHCFNSNGKFQVQEVPDFGQSDFFEDDVMLLDAYTDVYVWYGSGANELERKRSLDVASQYASQVSAQRADLAEKRVRVVQVFAGAEPSAFIAHFQSWDADMADSYTKRLRALQKAEADAIVAGKDFIAKTLEYTGELEVARPAAIASSASTDSISASASASGSVSASGSSTSLVSSAPAPKAGASSDLANEAAAQVAARAAEGGAPRVTTAEDSNAGISASIAERREEEMKAARAAANAVSEAEENIKRAQIAEERKSETQVAASKIAAWEAGQTGPSADDLRSKKQEDVRRERAGSLALSAAEADARRKADQQRADAIQSRLKAEREAKAAADAKVAAEEAANPKMSIWDRAAAEEKEIQKEVRTRLVRSVTASQLRAAEAATAVAAANAEASGQPEPVAAAVVATPEPVAPALVAASPKPAALVDPSSLFSPAVAQIRAELAKGQVKLVTDSLKVIKGQKDYHGTIDSYKSVLGHTRRDLGEAVIQVQENTSSAAFGALRGASQEQRTDFGRRLKAFVLLTNAISQDALPYLQSKLASLNEWKSTEEILLKTIRDSVATSFAEYETKIAAFAADQGIQIEAYTSVALPTELPTPVSRTTLTVTATPTTETPTAPVAAASAPTTVVAATPSAAIEEAAPAASQALLTRVDSVSVRLAEEARKAAEAEETRAAEERRAMEVKLREKRAEIAALQARVSSNKLVSSPTPPPEGPTFTPPVDAAPAAVAPLSARSVTESPISTPTSVRRMLESSPAPPSAAPSPRPEPTLVSSPALLRNDSDVGSFIPYAQLRKDLGGPPRQCNDQKLETYLSDAEFRQVFKMDRAAFYAQKDWQIRKAKTSAKLW